jgi:signal transduction histidine kinase/CheY-like chemotaxis protein
MSSPRIPDAEPSMSSLSRWLNQSLGRKIAAMVSVLLVLTVGALVVVFYLQIKRVNERTATERLRLLAGNLSEALGRGPGTAVAELVRLAADTGVARAYRQAGETPPAMPKALQDAFRNETRRVVALVDPSGRTILTQGSRTQPAWFGPAPEGLRERRPDAGPEIGSFQRLGDSTLYYDIRAPVKVGDRTLGVLVERFRVVGSSTARATIGSILGASMSLKIGNPANGVWSDLAGMTEAPPPEALITGQLNRFKADSQQYVGYAAPITSTGRTLLVRAPEATMMGTVSSFLRNAVLFGALALLLGVLGAIALGRRVNRPIREITEATERIAAGNFSGLAEERAPGEVGRLARSFNGMARQLGTSTQKLQESEASHRAFVSHSSQGIWRVEFPEGAAIIGSAEEQIRSWYAGEAVAECNPVLAEMYGLQAGYGLVPIPLATLYPPGDLASDQVLQAFISRGHRCSGVETREQRNGDAPKIFTHDLIGVIEDGRLRRIWGTRRDVTLERQLDERIAQSQRLESVGRLAGGIAHDFNNLLTVILADTETIQSRLGPDDAEAREIESAARRAADLTRQLLAFSRGQVLRPTVLDLNEVISSFETMLRRVIGEDIDLRLRLAEHLDPVEADAGQIERVIMNLVVNARDAMPNGGILELRTECVELDEEYVHQRPGVRRGRHVMIAVSDTGVGMSEEVRRQAFEPFFTTKPKGRGTGLGLASVYGVVRQSGGDISLYTEPGRGTTVKVYLPSAEGHLAERPAAPSRKAGVAASGGRVLLVEDDPAVRKMVRRSLGILGYSVLEAPDGEAALGQMRDADGQVDVVLTDMVMPGMSGIDLVGQLRSRWPGLGVVMMSGYTGDTYVDSEGLPPDVGFLEKPFAVADLQRTIQSAIAARAR